MGKKSRAKKKAEEEVEQPAEEDETTDEEASAQPETAQDEGEAEPAPEEEKSAPIEEKKVEKGFVGRYWLLFLGVILALIGLGGVIGLRLNIVQLYILGIQNPYPGIGYLEPQGHVVSMVPYCIGLISIYAWGLRAEPAVKREVEEEEAKPEEEPEAEEEIEAEVEEAPAEFGHEHLPPHHLSAEEKIEHLAKVRAEGKISEGLYKESLARFEAELKEEEAKQKVEAEHLPAHQLSPEEKIEH
ncbi:MAG: hypothetical protein AB1665_08320, partial [Candidatus Thermoplasmatota archaeon]